jgi:hypothetical protein
MIALKCSEETRKIIMEDLLFRNYYSKHYEFIVVKNFDGVGVDRSHAHKINIDKIITRCAFYELQELLIKMNIKAKLDFIKRLETLS